MYNCNIFCKSTTNSCSCRYLAYGIHLHIWDKQKVFQLDLGLAFRSGVMGLVVLLDLRSLAVECLRKTAVRIKMQSIYPSLDLEHAVLQKSDKGQVFYLSSQTCTRIWGLFDWLIDWLPPCSKTWKLPYFRCFQPDTQILSALTALYWPSTASHWLSTTKYQPVLPYTDPAPSCINHYRPLLILYHQILTSIAPYWPSTIMYQPVPPSTDVEPPSINNYRPILTITALCWSCTTKY